MVAEVRLHVTVSSAPRGDRSQQTLTVKILCRADPHLRCQHRHLRVSHRVHSRAMCQRLPYAGTAGMRV